VLVDQDGVAVGINQHEARCSKLLTADADMATQPTLGAFSVSLACSALSSSRLETDIVDSRPQRTAIVHTCEAEPHGLSLPLR
jgi:hypothetical protein